MTGEANRAVINKLLTSLYGEQQAGTLAPRLFDILQRHGSRPAGLPSSARLIRPDVFLITYGDQLQKLGEAPLVTLHHFCRDYLQDLISAIHILPFFPYTSDDGFSISDYRNVDPALGSWEDIHNIGADFRLMVDGVINHCSSSHPWFQGYRKGDPQYQDYFIEPPPDSDFTGVVRPRALPLLTPFDTPNGLRRLWTTFSRDQLDLNYHSPALLLEIIDILLDYVRHGAQFIRLDAIAYLWKEPGTTCIHLPQTHQIIQLFRTVLNEVAPYVSLVTETNVPHNENISYFGDGTNEAQMVYNFALPPLVLHAIQTGNTKALSSWASGLALPSDQVTFFNFLASHDGIGLNPAQGILTETEINNLAQLTRQLGGDVSYRQNSDGSQSPYELNINYFDALGDPQRKLPLQAQIRRFIAAQAVLLALRGIPSIYIHSLMGSRGWTDGVALTGQKRSINRQKFQDHAVRAELSDPRTLRSRVFQAYRTLLQARAASPAFHPHCRQQILNLNEQTFVIQKISPRGEVLAFLAHNLSNRSSHVQIPRQGDVPTTFLKSLLPGSLEPAIPGQTLTLEPYQVLWLAYCPTKKEEN